MAHNILLTGASGYLGGTLLADLPAANLPNINKLYALVRSDGQANAVRECSNAAPLVFDVTNKCAVHEAITTHEISIILFLVDAVSHVAQGYMIPALAEVKARTGKDVHFIHTSGAKLFSSHGGAPIDRSLADDEDGLHEVHKAQKAAIPAAQPAIETNIEVIELAEGLGVHAYIFVPSIVYGEGRGFGNRISIQTVAIFQAAQAVGRVHSVDDGKPIWPVCHLNDNTSLYVAILRAILSGDEHTPPHGRNGYYLAASGSVAWLDLYAAMAKRLAQRSIVVDDMVEPVTPEVRCRMAVALKCPVDMVALQLGGCCTFTAQNGAKIGWKPEYGPEHILEAAAEEVDLIAASRKD